MIDEAYHPRHRQHERQTDAEREAMARYCEELREAIAERGRQIRAELAAKWPQKEGE